MKSNKMASWLFHGLTPFQLAEISAILILNAVFLFMNHQQSWWYILIDSAAAICGVFCVVLCATGNRCSYYWGFGNIAGYIAISYINRYYGEVMLNAIYYLPMQFIGLFSWKAHYDDEKNHVSTRKMTPLQLLLWSAANVLGVLAYKMVLDLLHGNATLLDSISTVLSVSACLLMVLRYREQWLLWIVVDIVTVAMWIVAKDFIMSAMWSIFLVNAIYGLVTWTKSLSSSQATHNS